MADSFLGLDELLKISDKNLAELDITDLLQDAPLLAALAADTASHGTQHQYLKETGAPTVGFRAPNAGVENSKSSDTLVTVNCSILDASFNVDKAVADPYPKGGAQAFIGREAARFLKAAFAKAEAQYLYGQAAGAANGFAGMVDVLRYLDVNADMLVNAGGSTADTGSSVFLIRTGANDLQAIAGANGELAISESVVTPLLDGDGKRFTGYHTPIIGHMAMQAGSKYSFARICNLTAQAGKGLTDDLIYQALALFPASRQPNLIAMSRRSLEQLRESRTATNATGTPAPRPQDVEGIRIVVTDSIVNTEAIVANEP